MAWPTWLKDVPERRAQARQLGLRRRTHGHSMPGSPSYGTYRSWQAMKRRCDKASDTHYHYYGGRGIGYDPRWSVFANFYADMGDRPVGMTLDRINNDLGYSKGNCRWADGTTQSRNRRARVAVQGGQ